MNNRKVHIYYSIIITSLILFFITLNVMASSLKLLSQETINSLIQATSNPFIGLFIGLIATAIIQSSSAVTSIIVTMVAAGTISFQSSIPIIMGANIGTTLTSTLVSLTFVNQKNKFRRAIAAGTVHDMFNIIVTAILFPLEITTGFLSNITSFLSNKFKSLSYNFIDTDISFITHETKISSVIVGWFDSYILLSILSFIILLITIKLLAKYGSLVLIGESKEKMQRYFFTNPLRSFLWGTVITAGVQSSSVTTPLVVPLVATKKISMNQGFAFVMGANIGTTITALLVAIFTGGAAINVAVVHLLFNLFGVVLFLPNKAFRQIPVVLAEKLGKLTGQYRIAGFIYIIFIFFLLPYTLIYFSQKSENGITNNKIGSYHEQRVDNQ
ncbi:Na/Pi symporter [Mangrovivirga sp. M17]|uniref:Na/Pi symporter n=1 Tax=Mangrovivirga halotolerans TaxID=2993936 RepID=A0ABT3RU24_9BACT|nr:Na/Pi symporter [Mangrovivirga halotolerans]MCX2744853.1 Na/Pi symporter [Mangrovivirga halotolerans]